MTRLFSVFIVSAFSISSLTACVNSPGYLFSNDTKVAVETASTAQDNVEAEAETSVDNTEQNRQFAIFETCSGIDEEAEDDPQKAKTRVQYQVISQDIQDLLSTLVCQQINHNLPTNAVYIEPLTVDLDDNISADYVKHINKKISHHTSLMGLQVMLKPLSPKRHLFLRGTIARKQHNLLLHLFLVSQNKQEILASGMTILPYAKPQPQAQAQKVQSGLTLTR